MCCSALQNVSWSWWICDSRSVKAEKQFYIGNFSEDLYCSPRRRHPASRLTIKSPAPAAHTYSHAPTSFISLLVSSHHISEKWAAPQISFLPLTVEPSPEPLSPQIFVKGYEDEIERLSAADYFYWCRVITEEGIQLLGIETSWNRVFFKY